ncbi:MAG: hypothetical protein A2X36_02265 [Elusimicrobia bacterium GWA2_69_24]|nr:MAG: hypothetical protein A2X36_02265 [Elusimicrobia bacterium GWA2_69_24]HBH00788.1 hypothetical protein [Candidatus Rokubacteria bacterium]
MRLVHLDADPGLVKSILNNAADVGDEAYWAFGARNLILFGTLASDDYLQAATSPFYTVITYTAYWLFGVSMYTTRLPNALLGIAAVVLAYRLIRPYSKPAAVVAGLTLALENNFFIHTRMGQVEATNGFFALLAFYLLVRSKAPGLAGVALGLSVASKIVALLMLPAFALFFLLQWIRGVARAREMLRFCAGLAAVGGLLVGFVLYYHGVSAQTQGLSLLRNPLRAVVDFVTGYDLANPLRYDDVFMKNLVMQSQGVALVRNPARVLIDFVTGFYMSYPSTVLLVVLLGGYAWRARVALWVGRGARERLARLTDIEIMVVAWLAGYAVSMILLSDMHNRRMNLFTIPLALVPGLLVLRAEDEPMTERPRGLQVALLCAPPVFVGMLLGRRVLEALTGLGTGSSLLAAGLITVAATSALVVWARPSARWWERAGWVTLMAWVALASMSLGFSLVTRILPNLGVASRLTKVGIVIVFLTAMIVLGILARKSAPAVIVAMLLLSASLDAYDILGSSFSARDASLQVRAVTTSDDWGIGDGAHVLSLNAPYRPVQAYPGRGVNRDFAATVRPRFLFREVDHRDKRFNDPKWTEFSVREEDLYAIGASRVEAIAEFPLYPVLSMPGEVTYRLYRVTY